MLLLCLCLRALQCFGSWLDVVVAHGVAAIAFCCHWGLLALGAGGDDLGTLLDSVLQPYLSSWGWVLSVVFSFFVRFVVFLKRRSSGPSTSRAVCPQKIKRVCRTSPVIWSIIYRCMIPCALNTFVFLGARAWYCESECDTRTRAGWGVMVTDDLQLLGLSRRKNNIFNNISCRLIWFLILRNWEVSCHHTHLDFDQKLFTPFKPAGFGSNSNLWNPISILGNPNVCSPKSEELYYVILVSNFFWMPLYYLDIWKP